MDFSWMAWTMPTAAFFAAIALALIGMTLWQILIPSVERTGIFGIKTTRGDRFFVSLLGSALIEVGWVGIVGDHYVGSAVICLVYAWAVFRWY